jgi:hypothetical protein
MSADYCPKGDTSGSSYDGRCEKISPVPSTTTVIQTLTISQTGSVVKKSGLFASNPIVSAYDFKENERIPQNVASELNAFITKLTKIVGQKTGDNTLKRDAYYQAVTRYITVRIKLTSDSHEKIILQYLYKRFTVVKNAIQNR